MSEPLFNLAIETSGRIGSITLGKADRLLESITLHPPVPPAAPGGSAPALPPAPATPRNGADLMPAIDHLCQRHFASPRNLAEVYVSTGPGSFTGMRVAIATAKMLARFLDARVVAVPTIEATAMNVMPGPDDPRHLALCLNIKAKSAYTAVFHHDGKRWAMLGEATLRTIHDLLQHAPRPLMLLGQTLKEEDLAGFENVRLLPAALAQAHSDAVWTLGRQLAARGQFTDAMTLQPVYARVPEAVELWNQRHGAIA